MCNKESLSNFFFGSSEAVCKVKKVENSELTWKAWLLTVAVLSLSIEEVIENFEDLKGAAIFSNISYFFANLIERFFTDDNFAGDTSS